MPTGYTHNVQDGSLTEFRGFALQCARAFGACIELRDSPAETPIPDEFKPSDYHEKALVEAKATLARVLAMSDRDVARAADADYEADHESWVKRRERRRVERERYEAMLAHASAWTPPTAEHEGLKTFMVEQLTQSIEFDCSSGSWDKMPTRKTEAAWRSDAIAQAERGVKMHAEEHAKEVARARGRTEWVRALRASV